MDPQAIWFFGPKWMWKDNPSAVISEKDWCHFQRSFSDEFWYDWCSKNDGGCQETFIPDWKVIYLYKPILAHLFFSNKKVIFGSHRKTILFLDEIHRFNRAQQVEFFFDTFFGCKAINIVVFRIFFYLMLSKGIYRCLYYRHSLTSLAHAQFLLNQNKK